MMTAPIQTQFHPDECSFVEVLTTLDARKIGYRLGGSRRGPCLLVAGNAIVAAQVFERLLALPTLPWLRGELFLITLEALDAICPGTLDGPLSGEGIDEVLFLPVSATAETLEDAIRVGYRTVLRQCAHLGMIDGRGVH